MRQRECANTGKLSKLSKEKKKLVSKKYIDGYGGTKCTRKWQAPLFDGPYAARVSKVYACRAVGVGYDVKNTVGVFLTATEHSNCRGVHPREK